MADRAPKTSLARVTDAELLAAFDAQVRRIAVAPAGYRADLLDDPAPVLRVTPADANPESGAEPGPEAEQGPDAWGGGVFWCDLDESTADVAIAAAVEWFRPLGSEFEWKHYGYDEPADLPERLRAAGFEADEEEALVIGETDEIRARLAPAPEPEGVTLRRLRVDEPGRTADWRAFADVHAAVFHDDSSGMVASLAAAQLDDPTAMSVWIAEAEDGTAVCAARINFHEGTDFASLWGGGTLEAYRGRGIYKAMVARRADEAAARGYRFLQVDASPDSRPILERLGLRTLTSTTPWIWRP